MADVPPPPPNDAALDDAMAHSPALLAGIVQLAADGIISIDEHERIHLFNAGAEEIFGYSAAEILGQKLEVLIPERYRAAHAAEHLPNFARAHQTARRMGERREVFGVRKSGEEFPAEVSISKVEVGGGRMYNAVVRDVTERKRYEAALRERSEALARSNAELEQVAYVASHDLQEPLRMVSGFVQLLRSRYAGRLDEDADEFIGYIVEGTDRMGALIQALLAYSRVGRGELVAARVDTVELVARTVELLGAAIAERRARVEVDSDMPTVVGDAAQLGQVFQNLIQNALKFTAGDDPRVRVSGRRVAGGRRFTVTDNGIGVDPRHAARVFKLFQRLHGREEYPGTGIGLAICQKIVERHGGTIGVEPAAAGSGSTFWFEIPDREEAKAA